MKQFALSLFVVAASAAYVWDQAGKPPADNMLSSTLPADAEEATSLPDAPPPARAEAVATPPVALPDIRQKGELPGPATGLPATVGSETTSALAAPEPKPATKTSGPPRQASVPSATPEARSAPAPDLPAADTATQPPAFAVTPAVYIPIPQPRPDYRQMPARVVRVGMKLPAGVYTDGVYTGPVTDAYYGLMQVQASIQRGRLTALKVLKFPNDRRTSVSINRQALPMLRDEAISAQSANVDIISGATLTSRAFIQSLGGALKKASS